MAQPVLDKLWKASLEQPPKAHVLTVQWAKVRWKHSNWHRKTCFKRPIKRDYKHRLVSKVWQALSPALNKVWAQQRVVRGRRLPT